MKIQGDRQQFGLELRSASPRYFDPQRKTFLRKFGCDPRRYLHWLFQAKERFGLCVLGYIVTSNHVHLLVKDTGENVIAESMQLIAGRTAQEYNERKGKKGAFWGDRYHATAIEAVDHLHRHNPVRERAAILRGAATLGRIKRC
jgi:REP element-mobilizing transposase RayT